MGYFQVRYNSTVVNYDRRGFVGLVTGPDLSFEFDHASNQSEA